MFNYTGIIKQTAEQFIALGCREHMPAHEYFSVGYGRVYEQVTESQKNILIIKYIRI